MILALAYNAFLFSFGSLALANPIRHDALAGVGVGRKLTFTSEGNFKVLSFSDMHFGECEGQSAA